MASKSTKIWEMSNSEVGHGLRIHENIMYICCFVVVVVFVLSACAGTDVLRETLTASSQISHVLSKTGMPNWQDMQIIFTTQFLSEVPRESSTNTTRNAQGKTNVQRKVTKVPLYDFCHCVLVANNARANKLPRPS